MSQMTLNSGSIVVEKQNTKACISKKTIVVTLNARLQPCELGQFEDTLIEQGRKVNLPNLSGGFTQMGNNGEVESCELNFEVDNISDETIDLIINTLEEIGVPQGSTVYYENEEQAWEISFGNLEGVALYLNGRDLPKKVYKNHSLEEVHDLLEEKLAESKHGKIMGVWQGSRESAVYVYGKIYTEIEKIVQDVAGQNPLCDRCRIEQIA